MKEKFNLILSDRLIKLSVICHLAIFLIFILMLLWKWNTLPPQLPLFYSLPRGEEQLGTTQEFLLLPLISLIIFIFNHLAATQLYKSEPFLSEILSLTALLLNGLLLITFGKIIFLVA